MALNLAAFGRYLSGTIPLHTSANDKAADFPEYKDNLGLAFRYLSLGQASGAKEPLATGEADIRLLEIFPHPTGSGRIRCAMHHYCFLLPARKISYSALSYVWGKGEEDKLIVIDGRGFLVTTHLQNILWHLRETDRSVYVWIDAICIYQKMEVEKNAQISTMNDIYSTADTTIIFFGEEADDSNLVPRFLEEIREKLLSVARAQPTLQIRSSDLTTHGLPPASDRRWKALRSLLKREWFERKWCIQECALAKTIHAYVGTWTFDFDLLILVYQLCRQHGIHKIAVPGTPHEKLAVSEHHGLFIISILRRDVRHNFDVDSNSVGQTLPWLLAGTSYAKVSQARDAIYSLLGVYQVFNSLVELPYPVIEKEKDRSVQDVFIDYASIDAWKTVDQNTSLLELASQAKRISRLPSWVPDWSSQTPWEYLVYSDEKTLSGASTGHDRSDFIFNRSGKSLQVRAALFDVVTSVSYGCRSSDEADMADQGFDYLAKLTRVISCTTRGGHRPIVHGKTEVGDSIFVIHGERLPFVLRKSGAAWNLVGGAWLGCIMAGQALDTTSRYYVGDSLKYIKLI